MTRLRAAGYTNLHDFDIEAGLYEVECRNAAATDVELMIYPVTGAVIDIDDNWF